MRHGCAQGFSDRHAPVVGPERLIRRAAAIESISITEFTVAAAVAHARDVIAHRKVFEVDDAAWIEFLAALDRPVSHKPRLQKLFSEPSVFDEP